MFTIEDITYPRWLQLVVVAVLQSFSDGWVLIESDKVWDEGNVGECLMGFSTCGSLCLPTIWTFGESGIWTSKAATRLDTTIIAHWLNDRK
jgi:hypothetical protein